MSGKSWSGRAATRTSGRTYGYTSSSLSTRYPGGYTRTSYGYSGRYSAYRGYPVFYIMPFYYHGGYYNHHSYDRCQGISTAQQGACQAQFSGPCGISNGTYAEAATSEACMVQVQSLMTRDDLMNTGFRLDGVKMPLNITIWSVNASFSNGVVNDEWDVPVLLAISEVDVEVAEEFPGYVILIIVLSVMCVLCMCGTWIICGDEIGDQCEDTCSKVASAPCVCAAACLAGTIAIVACSCLRSRHEEAQRHNPEPSNPNGTSLPGLSRSDSMRSDSSHYSELGTWQCPQCTTDNKPDSAKCSVCGWLRGDSFNDTAIATALSLSHREGRPHTDDQHDMDVAIAMSQSIALTQNPPPAYGQPVYPTSTAPVYPTSTAPVAPPPLATAPSPPVGYDHSKQA